MVNKTLFISILCLFMFSCKTTKQPMVKYSEDQVFLLDDQSDAVFGKCYSESINQEGDIRWTEVVCENHLSKQLISEFQNNLTLLGYKIDPNEIARSIFGDSTQDAVMNFQKSEDYNFGIIDYATIQRIRYKSQ